MANPRNQSNNQSPMAAMNTTDQLPKYNPVSAIAKREALKLQSWKKRVHFIPLVVILCFIILWIFGSKTHHGTQGNVTIEDEIIDSINGIDEPETIKGTDIHFDLPILAVPTPGNASAPELLFRASPEIVPSPGRSIRSDLNPGSTVSLGFGPHRALLQIGNVTIKNEKINELGEIKKPVSIKETRYVFATRNATDPQPLFQASPEIAPLPVESPELIESQQALNCLRPGLESALLQEDGKSQEGHVEV